MSATRINEHLNALKAKLTDHAARYAGATMGAGEDWRRTFDRLREDIERFEFALKHPALEPELAKA